MVRVNELSFDVKHKPIVVIRFNPDGYWDGHKQIKSPFKKDKNGCYTIQNKEELKYWCEVLR